MHKDVHSKATYPLRVHQFKTQQVGKGGKRNKFSLMAQNPIMSMRKHVHYRELTVNWKMFELKIFHKIKFRAKKFRSYGWARFFNMHTRMLAEG